jgi:hypothetical protein
VGKNNSKLFCLLARVLRYITRHISNYAPENVPCRQTNIQRNLVEFFSTGLSLLQELLKKRREKWPQNLPLNIAPVMNHLEIYRHFPVNARNVARKRKSFPTNSTKPTNATSAVNRLISVNAL